MTTFALQRSVSPAVLLLNISLYTVVPMAAMGAVYGGARFFASPDTADTVAVYAGLAAMVFGVAIFMYRMMGSYQLVVDNALTISRGRKICWSAPLPIVTEIGKWTSTGRGTYVYSVLTLKTDPPLRIAGARATPAAEPEVDAPDYILTSTSLDDLIAALR